MSSFRSFSLVLTGLLLALSALSQGRVVLSNNAFLVIDNSAFLVLDNPNPNAITVGAGGGNIVSEAENDVIRWNIGANGGLYSIPWTTKNNVKIPLSVNLTTAGTGAGHFVFSTHPDNDGINNWNNDDYKPSDVTNMFGAALTNNSPNVIDRFWRIEQTGYTTPPQATLGFGYDDAERTNVGNTILAGTMVAQRFNSTAFKWIFPGSGADNFPTTTVTGVPVTSNFFKSWTLSAQNNQLPWQEEEAQQEILPDFEESISLYPNPVTQGQFTLHLTGLQDEVLRLELLDLTGKSIFARQIQVDADDFVQTVSLQNLVAEGLYLLSLKGRTRLLGVLKVQVLD
ncbi:MAG: T9SS type A sorting domain-containing protein [Bacteroidia bacterium]|nr:T9SS type A sorting domain-containing protein [Bacteroidia bacterium]